MIKIKAILSADLNWGIGNKGKLLKRVPEDMKFFAKTTKGKVVVMGRETLESLPGGRPLTDRVNIVLSSKGKFDIEGLIVCRSLEELFSALLRYNAEDVFIIGGESVYRQLLPYCTHVYVTRFYREFEADRRFPNLDSFENWEIVSESGLNQYEGMDFRYIKYKNRCPVELPRDITHIARESSDSD